MPTSNATGHRPVRLLAGTVALLAGLLGALPGCGGDGSIPDGVSPVKAPQGFVEFTGTGFTIAAPDTFTPQSQRSTNGEPKLTLNARPRQQGDDPTLVGVIRDSKPRSSLADQMKVLEDVKRLEKATEVSRQEVSWPGARQAFVVAWTQQTAEPSKAPGSPARTLQLAVEVNDTLIINVVATAPAASFDDTEVATVLRTFRLTK